MGRLCHPGSQCRAGRSAQCSESHCCHKYEPEGKYIYGQEQQRQQLTMNAWRTRSTHLWMALTLHAVLPVLFYILFLLMCIIKLHCNKAGFLIQMRQTTFSILLKAAGFHTTSLLYVININYDLTDYDVLLIFSDLLCYIRQFFSVNFKCKCINCSPHPVYSFALGEINNGRKPQLNR